MISGRVLALDLGKRRIGLALSDELGITAQGLETLQRTRLRDDLARLAKLASEHNVTLILMGNPLHMSGREGRGSEHAREFGTRLEALTSIPVQYWDERLTTVEAQRVLRESGASIEKRNIQLSLRKRAVERRQIRNHQAQEAEARPALSDCNRFRQRGSRRHIAQTQREESGSAQIEIGPEGRRFSRRIDGRTGSPVQHRKCQHQQKCPSSE